MFKKIKLERHSGVGGVEHGLVLLAAAVGALRERQAPHPHQPLNLSLATATAAVFGCRPVAGARSG